LKNIVTLKSRLGGHSPCEFMHDLYIAEIYRLGAMFLRLTLWKSLMSTVELRKKSWIW